MKRGDLFKTVEGYIYEEILDNYKWRGRYIHNNITFDLCNAIVRYSKHIGNKFENPEILKRDKTKEWKK